MCGAYPRSRHAAARSRRRPPSFAHKRYRCRMARAAVQRAAGSRSCLDLRSHLLHRHGMAGDGVVPGGVAPLRLIELAAEYHCLKNQRRAVAKVAMIEDDADRADAHVANDLLGDKTVGEEIFEPAAPSEHVSLDRPVLAVEDVELVALILHRATLSRAVILVLTKVGNV